MAHRVLNSSTAGAPSAAAGLSSGVGSVVTHGLIIFAGLMSPAEVDDEQGGGRSERLNGSELKKSGIRELQIKSPPVSHPLRCAA